MGTHMEALIRPGERTIHEAVLEEAVAEETSVLHDDIAMESVAATTQSGQYSRLDEMKSVVATATFSGHAAASMAARLNDSSSLTTTIAARISAIPGISAVRSRSPAISDQEAQIRVSICVS